MITVLVSVDGIEYMFMTEARPVSGTPSSVIQTRFMQYAHTLLKTVNYTAYVFGLYLSIG